MIKKMVKIFLVILLIIILIVGAYLVYLFVSYHRIEDNLKLSIDDGAPANSGQVKVEEEYTIVTQNIGFGAYSDDYTFFMDGGKESRARSKTAVIENTEGLINDLSKLNADFILFQEVDLNSTRSFHINQYDLLREKYSQFDSVKSICYDSAYLFYPILEPHGKSLSSISTFSKYQIEASVRRSLPVSTNISKFFDLDRCYSVSSVSVENGKTLYIYNLHLSAYGGSQEIRDGQINMLIDDMSEKIGNGDYVICGGDFNHDFTGNSSQLLNNGQFDFGWAQPFPIEKLPNDILICKNYDDGKLVPTTRNNDIPYEEGVSFVVIIDGFLVSPNVTLTELINVDNDFKYSDHNPVMMKFKLN